MVVNFNRFDVAFSDYLAGNEGVVNNNKIIYHRNVQVKQVVDAGGVAAADDVFFHVVTAMADAFGHALDGQFGGLQSVIKHIDVIARFLGLLHEDMVGFGSQSSFDGKVVLLSDVLLDARQHNATCGKLGTVRIER